MCRITPSRPRNFSASTSPRALSIELAAQRWCLLRYRRFLCDRPVNSGKLHDYKITCRDAMKTDRHPGVHIEQISRLGDRVQSWPHPRVGLDSQRLKGSAPPDADPMS